MREVLAARSRHSTCRLLSEFCRDAPEALAAGVPQFAFAASRHLIIIGLRLGAVSVVDTDSWLQVFERPNNGRTVHTVAIDASNDVAVYAEVGSPLVHVACLGETPTQLQLEGHSGPITAVAVSSTRVVSLSRAEVVVHHQVRTPDRVPAFHVLWRFQLHNLQATGPMCGSIHLSNFNNILCVVVGSVAVIFSFFPHTGRAVAGGAWLASRQLAAPTVSLPTVESTAAALQRKRQRRCSAPGLPLASPLSTPLASPRGGDRGRRGAGDGARSQRRPGPVASPLCAAIVVSKSDAGTGAAAVRADAAVGGAQAAAPGAGAGPSVGGGGGVAAGSPDNEPSGTKRGTVEAPGTWDPPTFLNLLTIKSPLPSALQSPTPVVQPTVAATPGRSLKRGREPEEASQM